MSKTIIEEHYPVVIDGFGHPEAWAITAVDSTMDEVPGYSWRTTGYLGALRQLQVELRKNGYDPDTGEWRIYEFDSVPDILAEGSTCDRVVIAVARGVVRLDGSTTMGA